MKVRPIHPLVKLADRFTLPLAFAPELKVDSFAGGGGASYAMKVATGSDPDYAVNHDGPALAMHRANHPHTRHYKEDVFLFDIEGETNNQPVGFGWFSPTCTHFSLAKGSDIRDQKIRGLCWIILKWAVVSKPRMMMAENVVEFLTYGPLDAKGRPVKEHKGRTFEAFYAALTTGLDRNHPDLPEIKETLGPTFPYERLFQGLGYKFEYQAMRACDYGAGTRRNRLFMVMRCDGLPIVWPAPTHGCPRSKEVLEGKLLPWPETADCIDWSLQGTSIFGRKTDLADATLSRCGKGLRRFLFDAERPYLRAVDGDDIAGRRFMASHVSIFRTGSVGHSLQEPLATITAGGNCQRPAGAAHALGLATAILDRIDSDAAELPDILQHSHVVKLRGTSTCYSVEEPLHTISAGGFHHAEVRARLQRNAASTQHRQQIREFLWKWCPDMAGIENPERVDIGGVLYDITDITMRMFTPRELATAQGFPLDYVLDPFYTYTTVNKKGITKEVTKRLPKSDQNRMIGNSVSPPPAIALIRANFFNDVEYRQAA